MQQKKRRFRVGRGGQALTRSPRPARCTSESCPVVDHLAPAPASGIRLVTELDEHHQRTVWNQDHDLVLAHPHTGDPLDHARIGLHYTQLWSAPTCAKLGCTISGTRSVRPWRPQARSASAPSRNGWARRTSARPRSTPTTCPALRGPIADQFLQKNPSETPWNAYKHSIPTGHNDGLPGSNPGSGTSVLPANPAIGSRKTPYGGRIGGTLQKPPRICASGRGLSSGHDAPGCRATLGGQSGALTHGRILQVELTAEGERRLRAAHPAVRQLEAGIEKGFTAEELAAVKAWPVAAAERLEHITASRTP
jgi:hypothetical protein